MPRDYLAPFEATRERGFDRDVWIRVLLDLYPAEEYCAQCFTIIQQHLGTPGQWKPPDKLPDQVPWLPGTRVREPQPSAR